MAYWGFDKMVIPSQTALMKASQAGFKFVIDYLAPTLNKVRQDTSWVGQRANVISAGLAPVPFYLARKFYTNTVYYLNDGTAEGQDAVNLALAQGYSTGTYIYIDIENPCQPQDQNSASYYQYIKGWVQVVIAMGFNPGIYCSYLCAGAIKTALTGFTGLRFWVYHLDSSQNIYPMNGPAPLVSNCGYSEATTWQFRQQLTNYIIPGATLDDVNGPIDLDTSNFTDPAH
ncbi:MAG TPA: glycoside hydrolase domain-containing protein [Mobilitalea sp.]|nr:glycoside hydrolase domain-containing protein [Mobilitalea sp.]